MMTKAITTVLVQEPGIWTEVLDKLKKLESALP